MAKQGSENLQNEAEVIGLMGLIFIAGDEARLHNFLHTTGLSPENLRQAASEITTHAAVLDYLMQDQSLLMVFSAESGLPPENIVAAHTQLSANYKMGEND